MTGDPEDRDETGKKQPAGEATGPSLRPRLLPRDDLARFDEPLPEVRLYREFKGLTVADLSRDELVDRLPGQVRSALQHIERGELAAAERVLPGEFSRILPGPGRHRRERRLLVWLVFVAAVLCAAVVATWFGS